jgi:type II secretory ATPase GspE/PulE/Tfp pilus assembly ATPase PilB-like protein
LEDPVEVAIAGVTQSQVNLAAGFDLAAGLRSVVRQDPEVIMIGEIRDRPTAEVALQASLTGQLVLSSFHAGSSSVAVSRLVDMGIEPYVLRSGVLAIISQRLARRLCECAREDRASAIALNFDVRAARAPVGCQECGGVGYRGRIVLAELLRPQSRALQQAILSRCDAASIGQLAVGAGMITLHKRASAAIEAGLTSAAEARRVLGFGDETRSPANPEPASE